MNTINKDNAGSIVLLGGMFLAIAAATFSATTATAKETSLAPVTNVETIVVTATHLK
jgi:hypothetical protein